MTDDPVIVVSEVIIPTQGTLHWHYWDGSQQQSGNCLLTTTLWHIKCSHFMWHLWSPSKLIMPKKLNVAAGSSGVLKQHHIVRDMYYSLPICSTVEKNLVSLSLPRYQSKQFLKHWDLYLLTRCLQRPWFCLEPQRHWVYPAIQQEQAHSFVMPTDLLLVQISEASAHLATTSCKCFACLVTDNALRICLRKLLGRTVNRLLQIEGHGKRKRE